MASGIPRQMGDALFAKHVASVRLKKEDFTGDFKDIPNTRWCWREL